MIPNTKVPDTPTNRRVIEVCERYRHAMEARDADALIALASPHYYEDSGTPKADDDYGYEGLRRVVRERMALAGNIRYEMEYRKIHVEGKRAEVEVYLDASFQLAMGKTTDQYRHVTQYNKLQLENDGKRWLFVKGM